MGNSKNKLQHRSSSLPHQEFPTNHLGNNFQRSFSVTSKLGHHGYLDIHKSTSSTSHLAQTSKTPHSGKLLTGAFSPEYDSISTNERHFEVQEIIAKGVFGNVLKVSQRSNGAVFAMKVMLKSRVILDGAVKQSKDEASILKAVGDHPFIVTPLHFFQNLENVYIVMEFMPRGELFTAWLHCDRFTESLVKIYIAELAMVLDYLHRSNVIYRDMKMENILIDGFGHIQVIDFGLAKWLKKSQRTRTVCGTLQYIAPEVLNTYPYGHAADWWSLGILMYALLIGEYPVNGAKDHVEMAKKANAHEYDFPHRTTLSWEARQCARCLLQRRPADRIKNLIALQRQPFFDDISFDTLYHRQININPMLESQGFPLERNFQPHQNVIHSTESLANSTASKVHQSHPGFQDLAWHDSVVSLDGSIV